MKTRILGFALAAAVIAASIFGCASVQKPPETCPAGQQTEASVRDDLATAMQQVQWRDWGKWALKCFGIPLVKATVLTLIGELETSVLGGATDEATLTGLDHMKAFAAEQGW